MTDWHAIEGWFSDYDNRANRDIAAAVPNGALVVCLGVWHGRSLVALAHELTAADKPDVTIVAVDQYPANTLAIAARNLGDWPNLWLVQQDIVRAAAPFADRSVAAIYIDAGHDYDTSHAALQAWLPKIQTGGIVSGHDYQPNWPGVVRAVNESLAGHPLTIHGCSYLTRLQREDS